jgi:pantothenate synthetase
MINSTPGCRSDYAGFVDEATFEPVETADTGKEYRLLLAMYSGTVRLIDNAKIRA